MPDLPHARRPAASGKPPEPTAPVAVVTGAARGIGQAVAARLAASGHRVVLADLDVRAARRAAERIGPDHLAVDVDVSAADSVHGLAAAAQEHFGRIDVWVNNAGLLPGGELAEQSTGLLSRTWEVNLGGTVHGCRAALTHMRRQGAGHIVNIASVTAVRPVPGLALYGATSAGITALSEALRREVRDHGVHVSVVLPRTVDTPAAAGLGRHGRGALSPEQVADSVAKLLRRPAARRYVPRSLSWTLPLTAALPGPLRAAVDAWTRTDAAAHLDSGARADYDEELALQAEAVAEPAHPEEQAAEA